jgi:hypothetical protein
VPFVYIVEETPCFFTFALRRRGLLTLRAHWLLLTIAISWLIVCSLVFETDPRKCPILKMYFNALRSLSAL